MKQLGLPLTALFALCILTQRCESRHHYCIIREQDLEVQHDQPIVLFDAQLNPIFHEVPENTELRRCKWDISFDQGFSAFSRQVVLQAVSGPTDKSTITNYQNRAGLTFRWSDTAEVDVTSGLLHVYQIDSRKLTVQSVWDPRTHSNSLFSLRLLVPLPGNCGTGLFSWRGRCYLVSSTKQTATEAMESLGGDAQLASFGSIAEMKEFFATYLTDKTANSSTSTQPIRLGLFFSEKEATVLTIVRNGEGRCQLSPVDDSSEMTRDVNRLNGNCANVTMRDWLTEAPIEFNDCDAPMLSLLSFPDSADKNRRSCSIKNSYSQIIRRDRKSKIKAVESRPTKSRKIFLIDNASKTGVPALVQLLQVMSISFLCCQLILC